MACISSSPLSPSSSSFSHLDQTLRKSLSNCAGFLSSPTLPPPVSRFPHFCRCSKSRSDSPSPYDDFIRPPLDSLQDAARNAIRWWSDYFASNRGPPEGGNAADAATGEGKVRGKEGGDWDWERWRRHFQEVEEQERIVTVLKAQLSNAVCQEDYEDAAKLKVAIAAAARTDTVGKAIFHLHRAVEEERYKDAAFIRDDAGAGLVGWWAGVSEDSSDPYGRIIHISAEHGRYVARSYSSRQLATNAAGVPVFEVFITANDKGEYKQQAVYLKRQRGNFGDDPSKSSEPSSVGSLNSTVDLAEGETDLSAERNTDLEDGEGRENESDVAEEEAGIQSILRDMIPGFKVNSIKVVATGKIDTDLIFKAFEQDSDDEDDDKVVDLESIEEEEQEEDDHDPKAESDTDDIEMNAGAGVRGNTEDGRAMVVKIVIGEVAQKLSNKMPSMDLLRIPASLEKRGRTSFLFSIKKDEKGPDRKGQASLSKSTKTSGQRSIDLVMSDLAKVILSREKIPTKMLKDVEELINLTLSQAQKRQPLSGSTIFNRIEIPATSDPLNGLYIGAHGLYTSEVIHLRRRFGQWQEDDGTKKPPGSEFYEYVEALKLTGDPYVPAGQVAFRAKIGKRNQLPHKGIIPEEFGVVARYRGQGRLAEPGFENPRWVDGELVILDGKYIKGGPVVGFVYWAPEYHFLVFFNRLKLSY